MKHLLLICLLIPAQIFAQNRDVIPAIPKNEVGFNAGAGVIGGGGAVLTGGLRYNHNFSKWQVGVQVNGYDYGIFSPLDRGYFTSYNIDVPLVLNRTYNTPKRTIYFGASAGYTYGYYTHGAHLTGRAHGMVGGVQGGYTYHLGKHFSLNGEVAVVNHSEWMEEYHDPTDILEFSYYNGGPTEPYTTHVFYNFFTVPFTIGVRYRF